MNHTELAFVNQQLASMLRCGIPLEGALRQLCATMSCGPLRRELQLLEGDLAAGVPLAQAAARRKLPDFYSRLLALGARGNDLPGILALLADYYENAAAVWTQLKGLMVYPAIVLALSLAFSVYAAVLGHHLSALLEQDRVSSVTRMFTIPARSRPPAPRTPGVGESFVWAPTFLLTGAFAAALAAPSLPWLRRRLAWRVPAFREASLCRAASAMAVLLRAGATFPDALALLEEMQRGTPAAADFALWKKRCAEGGGNFVVIAAGSKVFPPMFVWLAAGAGEDLAGGFERAAKVYQGRAAYLTNVLLYAALPASLLFLGLIILSQIYPIGRLIFDLPRLFF